MNDYVFPDDTRVVAGPQTDLLAIADAASLIDASVTNPPAILQRLVDSANAFVDGPFGMAARCFGRWELSSILYSWPSGPVRLPCAVASNVVATVGDVSVPVRVVVSYGKAHLLFGDAPAAWSDGESSLVVGYVAGPDDDATVDVARMAALKLVARWSDSGDDGQGLVGIPADVAALLAPYKTGARL